MTISRKPVLELFRPQTWRSKVASIARKSIPSDVLAHIKDIPGEDMYEDTMLYLEDAYRACGYSFNPSVTEALTEAVLGKFSLFRGYHGCRPSSLESYHRDGLVVLNCERLAKLAYEVLGGSIPLPELERRARFADLETRADRVYFCADADYLVSECGHYLLQGSEALNCLWDTTNPDDSRWFDECQQRSRSHGIPTVFVCDVPIDSMERCYRSELGRTLLTLHLQLASSKPVLQEDWSRNWGYAISRDLPASHIKSHFHPASIPDPLRPPAIYRNPQTRCEWCPAPVVPVI